MSKEKLVKWRAPKEKLSWDQLVKTTKSDQKTYSQLAQYNLGDSISHDKFGVGFVVLIVENKIEVLFEDKQRVMVHKK